MSADGWEAVIGLEVHVELNTRTKMFSATPNAFGGAPNTRVGAVDLGLPGTLPVVNGRAVEYAIRLGLALGCDIVPSSEFHRKNYFYPDMPKNYQISQYDVAICEGGQLEVTLPDGSTTTVGITRVHMEEDAGKTVHVGASGRVHGADHSLVDYNRAGVPLLECVSEPDIRTAEQAQAYLTELRAIVLALGISDAKLEEGSMRCDANVSVHRPGTPYGTRAEIKNLNSVRSLGRAIDYEIARQIDVLESGGEVVQETRHWDEDRGTTSTLRRKETLDDYRYFPDPDLVAIAPDPAWVEEIRAVAAGAARADPPAAGRARPGPRRRRHAVRGRSGAAPRRDRRGGRRRRGGGEVAGQRGGGLAERDRQVGGGGHQRRAPGPAAGARGRRHPRQGRGPQGPGRRAGGLGTPAELAQGHAQVSDEAEIEALVDQVIAEQADAAQKVRDGNDKAIGALVGGVMRLSKGKANPGVVNRLLAEKLSS
jgi:aspartyl-tRNA(Asn)/glutamyl-tRNA(Gln) amidotransferase subunit B